MFKLKSLLFFLALSATSLSAAPTIQINSLPFTILTPGNYVLTRNLTFTGNQYAAITIYIVGATSSTGPITLDLKGFTITNLSPVDASYSYAIYIQGMTADDFPGIAPQTGLNVYPITIRNGTLTGFSTGILDYKTYDVTINNIVFNFSTISTADTLEGVSLFRTRDCIINNCYFNNPPLPTNGNQVIGISDAASYGGSSYNNDIFTGNTTPFSVTSGTSPFVLDHCQFAAPQ